MSDGLVAFALLTGPEHVIEICNPGFDALFPHRTCVGVPLAEVAPELDERGALAQLDKVYSNGEPFYASGQPLTLAGVGDLLFDVRLEPRHDGEGKVAGVTVIAVDVTERTRTSRLLRAQRELLEQVATSDSVAEILTRLVQVIEGQSTDSVLASLLLVEDGRLRHGAAPSLPDFYNEAIDGEPIGPVAGSCGTAAYRREQVVVTDISTDPLWVDYRDLAARAELRACWSSPVFSTAGEVIGTFAMYYRTVREPTTDDLAASEAFARTAALAIERQRLEQARAAAQADLKFLLDAATAIANATGHVDSAERLARLIVPRLCAACVIDLVTDNTIKRVAAAVHGNATAQAELLRHIPPLDSDHPVARVLGAAEPQTLRGPDIRPYAGSPEHLAVLEAIGVSEFASVPLTARGTTTFGALTMMALPGHPLTDAAIAVAEDLSGRVAQVLETIWQYDRRVRLVRDLQTELLPPRLPTIDGLALAASYHPGTVGLDVGGDFYDVLPLSEGKWGLLIGDVSGRGARAASTTALVRYTARAVAPLAQQAADVLTATNDALLADDDAERFITAMYVELTRTGAGWDAEIVSAGHPPALIRHSNGSVEATTAGGPLLGQIPGVTFHVQRAALTKDDVLVMVTDGVLEARDSGRQLFGDDRLVEAVASAGSTHASAVVTAVDDAVATFAAATLDDDRAVLAVTVG